MKRRLSYLINCGIADGSRWGCDSLLRHSNLNRLGGDLPARGLLVFFVALEATSLANVWVQADSGPPALSANECAMPRQKAMPIAAGARGRSDV